MPDVTPLYAGRESDDYLARDSGWIRQLKLIRFRALAKTLLKYLPDHGTAKIADFGTGNGMLVACMKSVRPGTKVIGLDFFDEPPAEIGQADYCGFADAGEFKGTIDLLTCFHALEHDDDPHAFLEGLLSYLKPGGVLVLEVPNVDCVWTPWFGDACANWYAPYHRLHFSRQSLADLFENHGLTVMAEEDVCGPTIALSLANLVGVKPSAWIFAAGVAARPIQWLAEKMTGRPSALRMIAQKR
jgi:2-polyprenyl-3-methyl-5-hydroxy-6-metoxy-1,4-benzoquinol methylase